MISLGIVDILLILLFAAALYMSFQRRATAFSMLIAVLLVFVLLERVAPGALTQIGDGIHNIDRINNSGPHITIDPIVRFEK